MVRFTEYGALRPPGLAEAVTPSRGRAGSTDRAAALWVMLRTRRHTTGWGAELERVREIG